MRYSSDLETTILKHFASRAKHGIVEIGVFDGENTKELASVTNIPIYAIDPIVGMEGGLIGNEELISINIRPHKNVKFIKDTSHNVYLTFNHKIDMVWIDGDHTGHAPLYDFNDWYSKLEMYGICLFHDSAPCLSEYPVSFHGWPNVIDIVNELKHYYMCIGTWDTLTGFRKV